jgi:hypothetical protein
MQPSRVIPAIVSTLALAFTMDAAIAAPARAQTLRGSPASVDLMYTTAEGEKLLFMRTTADIYQAARVGALKLITFTDDLELDHATFPFVLPATKRFADSLAHQYHLGCGERIGVTSGARPMDKQPRNASPKSVHPTGMAVDFRKPRNPACLKWMRENLVKLEDAHVIEATEEMHPPHFHVAVLHQAHEPHFQLAAVAPDSAKGGKVRTEAGEVALRHTRPKRRHVKSEAVGSP